MRTLITSLFCWVAIAASSMGAETRFLFHVCKDNYTQVGVLGDWGWFSGQQGVGCEGYLWRADGYFDLWTSGEDYSSRSVWKYDPCSPGFVYFELSDGFVFDWEFNEPNYSGAANPNRTPYEVNVWMCGPGPDYFGYYYPIVYLTYNAGELNEFWIDFAQDGTTRVLSFMPTDFGKWAWDGAVNQSYIEPSTQAIKKRGKGHNK